MKTFIKALFKFYNGVVLIISFATIGLVIYLEKLTNWKLFRGLGKACMVALTTNKEVKDLDADETYTVFNNDKIDKALYDTWDI